MDRRFDPRSIVTPYAFSVHPDLLGRPLATPWQRLGAILVDLIVIGFISQVGVAPLAIGSTILLFWLATRQPGKEALGKMFRIAVGCLGFIVLALTVVAVLWFRYGAEVQELVREVGETVQAESGAEPGTGVDVNASEGQVGLLEVFQGFQGVGALQTAVTQEEAQGLINNLVESAFDAGLSRRQVRELLSGLIPEDAAWISSADGMVDLAIANLTQTEAQAANQADESAPAQGEVLPGELSETLSPAAVDSIDRLNRTLQLVQEDREDTEAALDRARQDLEEEQSQGPFDWLLSLIDELGIGFGWAAFYLTITHARWNGTSIGKKLFKIRVVMIDNRPLNWWLSFERAGGYAAGFATGLLGFAQIFWDPNRQAIHDKVSETFVIQEGKEPIPGPWIAEGKAQWTRGRGEMPETPMV